MENLMGSQLLTIPIQKNPDLTSLKLKTPTLSPLPLIEEAGPAEASDPNEIPTQRDRASISRDIMQETHIRELVIDTNLIPEIATLKMKSLVNTATIPAQGMIDHSEASGREADPGLIEVLTGII
jgi:hypothetical protein